MATYLKLFETHTQYETFIGGGGVTPFVKPNVSYCVQENEVHYNPRTWADEYLTFVALEDGTFTFAPSGGNVISYSIDNGHTWSDLAADTNTPTVTRGNKVLWRGEMTPITNRGVGTFSSTGKFKAQGNIMSLLFGADFKGQTDLTGKDYAFYRLFSSNSNLVNVQNLSLPATTLAESCYDSMFYGCTSLVNAPTLPATTLAGYCYSYMFYGCTNLVNAPSVLPATTLAGGCYTCMFRNCTSLVNAPTLPATTLAVYCYQNMFNGCTSLVKAPTLPATTLEYSCYQFMFDGCTKLSYIKCLATKISASSLSNWVNGVASSGTFVKDANMTSWTTGISGIPTGWTVQDVTV